MGLVKDDEEGTTRPISDPLVFNENSLTFSGKSSFVSLGISPLE
jgi:hypothetical protein